MLLRKENFRRFHVVHERRLQSFVQLRAVNHFPARMVPYLVEEVTSETMATVWRCWERLGTPEHVMFRIAEFRLIRRMPKEKRLAFIPFGEEDGVPEMQATAVTEPDPLDEIEELLALDQMIDQLPEPQRSYARSRRNGSALDDIGSEHGRTKGTISIGLKKAADRMPPLADIINVMIGILHLAGIVGPLITAAIAALLALLRARTARSLASSTAARQRISRSAPARASPCRRSASSSARASVSPRITPKASSMRPGLPITPAPRTAGQTPRDQAPRPGERRAPGLWTAGAPA
ncbi:RNA polymerase sigma factor [Streptomyces sp. AC495_CC817]|uniref:RNA polymerase sigma factor n=1 Tax=Streptomyces sp. AC495_CC817 TaxID=2823900 RepID=UPI001C27DDFB|nr:sigma-70 family RNA polymerase sigma factor [Streptomyces sp. AC495_CC817]